MVIFNTPYMPQKIKQHPDDPKKFLIEKKTDFWYDFDKTKPDLKELFQFHDGDAIVMGSGPSLPDDIYFKVPDKVFILGKVFSCNHHPLHQFRAITDYMCFLDPVQSNHDDRFKKAVWNPRRKYKNISYVNLEETDYYCVNEAKFHNYSDTGIFATWVASYVCTGDIYLCGFGLRNPDEQTHYYDSGLTSEWGGATLDVKLKRWNELFDHIGRDRIKVMSGPLK